MADDSNNPRPETTARKLLAAIRAAMAELERGQPQRALVILSGAEAVHG